MKKSNKTLVAYATRGGVTKEYAEIISEVLREQFNHKVDTIDIKNKPNISEYDNIIFGTGVRIQNVYREGLRFLRKDFGGKKVAIFLSSNEAGTPHSYNDAVEKYMNPIREKFPKLNLVDIEGFGGQIKILGKSTVDLRDPDKARRWTEQLGKKL